MMTAKGGFDFSLYQRNCSLEAQGKLTLPKATSTGTTIVGLIYKDGVVLGADTRATSGPIVADKNCEKIHYLTDHLFCCGAGTAADTEAITALIRSNLHLHQLNSNRRARAAMALTMFKQRLFNYQGHIGAALILGGVDDTGSHLYTIYPHGSTDKLPFVTMGSGSLAAMSIFETKYRPNLEKEEAIQLVTEAIQAGIFNDLGSGSNVDVVVISKLTSSPQILRNHVKPNERIVKQIKYIYPRGSTRVIKESVVYFKDRKVEKQDLASSSLSVMDIS